MVKIWIKIYIASDFLYSSYCFFPTLNDNNFHLVPTILLIMVSFQK